MAVIFALPLNYNEGYALPYTTSVVVRAHESLRPTDRKRKKGMHAQRLTACTTGSGSAVVERH